MHARGRLVYFDAALQEPKLRPLESPTTLGLVDRDAAKKVLSLPPEIEAFCLIPVGWPMGNFGPVTRLPVSETMRWDRWETAE